MWVNVSSGTETGVILATSEFVLKSSPVRRTLEQRLVDDLKVCLKINGFDNFTIEKRSARMLIRGLSDAAKAASLVSNVFGVAYAAEVTIVPANTSDVLEAVVKHASEALEHEQSFAVRSKRSEKSQLSRREIETKGGAEILNRLAEKNVKVDLENPDVLISVDTADDLALIYRNKIRGPGGLPISSQWKILAVLDSGLLSILAAYAMMRRGCLVELFIPVSLRVKGFVEEAQLGLATTLRSLVTRSQYYGYVMEVDNLLGVNASRPALRFVARRLSLKFAERNKFRGIILADVSGKISGIQEDLAAIPIFHPLIGLTVTELLTLCDLAKLSVAKFESEVASWQIDAKPQEPKQIFADGFHVDRVSLGFTA